MTLPETRLVFFEVLLELGFKTRDAWALSYDCLNDISEAECFTLIEEDLKNDFRIKAEAMLIENGWLRSA